MLQKFIKKSLALKIGIPRKGWSVSKCGSPVMMHEACDAMASSRIMLSSGSWQ